MRTSARGRGVYPDADKRGQGGGSFFCYIFADVLYGWPPMQWQARAASLRQLSTLYSSVCRYMSRLVHYYSEETSVGGQWAPRRRDSSNSLVKERTSFVFSVTNVWGNNYSSICHRSTAEMFRVPPLFQHWLSTTFPWPKKWKSKTYQHNIYFK